MNAFINGFEKTAGGRAKAAKGVVDSLKEFAGKAQTAGRGYLSGMKASGNVALKEHLNPMTAVKHYQDAFNAKGLKNKMIAAGKALPSTIATGGYLYGGKKLYDKTLGGADATQSQSMSNYYYG